MKNLNARLGRENGRRTFPGEIEADIEVDGLPSKHIRAKLDEDVHTPMIEEVGDTVKAKRMKPKVTYIHSEARQKQYTLCECPYCTARDCCLIRQNLQCAL